MDGPVHLGTKLEHLGESLLQVGHSKGEERAEACRQVCFPAQCTPYRCHTGPCETFPRTASAAPINSFERQYSVLFAAQLCPAICGCSDMQPQTLAVELDSSRNVSLQQHDIFQSCHQVLWRVTSKVSETLKQAVGSLPTLLAGSKQQNLPDPGWV